MTTNEAAPEKSSLWREGLRCFGRHWKPWLRLAFWFMVAFMAMNFFIKPEANMAKRFIQENAKPAAGDMSGLAMSGLLIFIIATVAVTVVQYYMFNVFFLSREQVFAKEIKPGSSGFWYYVGQRLLSAIFFMFPMFAGGVIAAIIIPMIHNTSGAVVAIGGMATTVIVIAAYLFSFYAAIKFFLVGVLACGRIKPALKTSWALTKNNWWRLFGNGLMLSFLMMLVFIPVSILAQGGMLLFPKLWPVALLVNAVFSTLLSGVMCAFGATALRTLYQERRKKDPSFALAGMS